MQTKCSCSSPTTVYLSYVASKKPQRPPQLEDVADIPTFRAFLAHMQVRGGD